MKGSYTDLVCIMGGDGRKINEVLRFIVENSLISWGQFEVISKRREGGRHLDGRSRGAYYRLLEQSRAKIRAVIYSILLLQLMGLIDEQGMTIIDRVARQVAVTQGSDVDEGTAGDVIRVMEELIRRLSKI